MCKEFYEESSIDYPVCNCVIMFHGDPDKINYFYETIYHIIVTSGSLKSLPISILLYKVGLKLYNIDGYIYYMNIITKPNDDNSILCIKYKIKGNSPKTDIFDNILKLLNINHVYYSYYWEDRKNNLYGKLDRYNDFPGSYVLYYDENCMNIYKVSVYKDSIDTNYDNYTLEYLIDTILKYSNMYKIPHNLTKYPTRAEVYAELDRFCDILYTQKHLINLI